MTMNICFELRNRGERYPSKLSIPLNEKTLWNAPDVEDDGQSGCYHHHAGVDFVILVHHSQNSHVNKHSGDNPNEQDGHQRTNNLWKHVTIVLSRMRLMTCFFSNYINYYLSSLSHWCLWTFLYVVQWRKSQMPTFLKYSYQLCAIQTSSSALPVSMLRIWLTGWWGNWPNLPWGGQHPWRWLGCLLELRLKKMWNELENAMMV